MPFPQQRGQVTSLLLSCHPLPAGAMTGVLSGAAAISGRSRGECVLVAATVLSGQLTIGWINDVVDRERDRASGRADKPVARGWIAPRTVTAATACMVPVLVPLSFANGTASGLAHLTFVLSGWGYDLWFKENALSWLPYAVGFGALPAFLSYGGLGFGRHGAPPTTAMTVSTALLGVGIHFLNALPDLEEDTEAGVRHLPLRLASRVGARRLLAVSAASTACAGIAVLASALTVGLRRRPLHSGA
jgi:4-hydroxybenzoate polyprenyltransferase